MSRSVSADLVKTLSIFGVVFIHASQLSDCESLTRQSFSWLFRFCVPCFIILWAYFFEKSYVKKEPSEKKEYIKKRFIHSATVFIIWSIMYYIVAPESFSLSPSKILTMYFSGYGWSGQYFFIILLQLILFYPLIRLIYAHKFLRYAFIAVIASLHLIWGYASGHIPSAILKLGDRPFIFWVLYVFIGISLARNQFPKLPKFFAASVLIIPVEFFLLNYFHIEHSPYITPGVLLGSSLSCIAMLQNEFTIKSDRVRAAVQYVGSNTMTVFVLNPLLVLLTAKIMPPENFPCIGNAGVAALVVIIAVVFTGVALLVAELIKKLKLDGILN